VDDNGVGVLVQYEWRECSLLCIML